MVLAQTMTTVDVIANETDLCGEGPLWSAASETLFWVDITGRRLHSYDARSRAVRTWSPGVGLSALALTESGDLIGAGGDGVWLLQGESFSPVLIAREHHGELLAINDGIADPAGRLLVGSSFLNPAQDYPLGKLYAVAIDGALSIVDDGFHLANGMGFSVDGRTFYATDSILRSIYAYDYDASTGTVSRKRVLVKVPDCEGLPDGLTVDAEGFIWSAQWFGGCVCRYDPDGRLERRVSCAGGAGFFDCIRRLGLQ